MPGRPVAFKLCMYVVYNHIVEQRRLTELPHGCFDETSVDAVKGQRCHEPHAKRSVCFVQHEHRQNNWQEHESQRQALQR